MKIKMTLDAGDALALLAFMREFVNDSNREDPQLHYIHEVTDNFENEFLRVANNDVVDYAIHANEVQALLGKTPKQP